MVIVSAFFLNFFTRGFARAMALYPFIIVKNASLKKDGILMNHERIHLRQQLEMLFLAFYLWYLTEYFIKLMRFKDHRVAYADISFEREAYRHEADLNYLRNRKFWAFLKYL